MLINSSGTVGPQSWDILLIGGASGTGKSRLSYPLAMASGATVTEIDDLHAVAQRMTTPDQQPVLHFWDTDPHSHELSAREIVELHCAACDALEPAIEAVVSNHVDEGRPVVLEGDYLLPAAARRMIDKYATQARIRALFLYEDDERQLVKNFRDREPDEAEQVGRALVSSLLNQRIQSGCERSGVLSIPARPWDTVVERVTRALDE